MIGIMLDVWREARARYWFTLLFVVVSLILVGLTFFLRLEVVDGALTATQWFGQADKDEIRPVDVALRPVFHAFSQLLFYGGPVFGIIACSEFAPSLLAPGRIELLLSFPISRASLLIGTFVAIATIAFGMSAYATVGVTTVFFVKTGVFSTDFIAAGVLAVVCFLPIYAAMLLSAVLVRSAALSAGVGFFVFAMGLTASYRPAVVEAFSAPVVRLFVDVALRLFVPTVKLARSASDAPAEIGGALLLGGALISLAIFVIEGKDF